MKKFFVGERYKVGGKHDEAGNIIEITRVGSGRCMYKTIKGKAPEPWAESFDKKSSFAKNLISLTGREKVVILRKGNTITATRYVDCKKCGTGVAKCSPEDSFDFGTGAKLALERLFKSEKPSMSREDVYNKTKEVLSAAPLKFDWDKFSNGEVFVQVSRKTIGDFLRRCEDLNFECVSGKRPTEINLFHDYDAADKIAKLFFRAFELNPGENIWFRTVGKKLALTTKAPESEKTVFKW